MFEKIRDFYYNIVDAMPTILAIFVTILFTALVLGFVLGVYCFLGWILMLVWSAIAAAFNLPVFSYWIYVGIVVLLMTFRKTIKVKVNRD